MLARALGDKAEKKALIYLKSQGLCWLESNFRTRCGEIDLIMQDGSVLVFVEVRARSSKAYGGALQSVTWHKQQKLIKSAQFYLQRFGLDNTCVARFDVVSFDGVPPEINWVKDAFGL